MLKSLSLIVVLIIISFSITLYSYSQQYKFYINNSNTKYIVLVNLDTYTSDVVNITLNNFTHSLIINTPYNLTLANSSYSIIITKYSNTYIINVYELPRSNESTYLFYIFNNTKQIGTMKIIIYILNNTTFGLSVTGNGADNLTNTTNSDNSNTFIFGAITIASIFLTIFARIIKKNK